MPIPQYQQRTVSPQGLPDTRFSPNTSGAFGEAIGAGLQDIAQTAERIQREDDDAAIKNNMSEFRRRVNEMQFTGEDAYFNRKGEAAYTSLFPQMKALEKERKQFGEELTPRQRERFDQIAQEYIDRENDQMSRHATKERTQWRNQSDEALILSAQEDGSLRWNSNDEYSTQIKKSIGAIANRNGWPPEKREIEERRALSGMHVTAIDNILEQSPERAQAYFQKNRDDILPSLHDDIARKIEGRDTDMQAQSAADAAVILGDESQAREYIKSTIDDPGVRQKANALIREEFAARTRDSVQRREKNYSLFDEMVRQGNKLSLLKKQYGDQWDTLSPGQKSALEKGVTLETNPKDYYEAKGYIAAGEPDKAWSVIERGGISNTDAKRLIDQIVKPPAQIKTSVLTHKQAFDKTISSIMGSRPTAKNKKAQQEHDAKYRLFMGMYQERVDEWHQNNPTQKYMPPNERDRILDEFLIKATREESLWGIDALWPDKEATLKDVPAEELRQIEEKLRQGGYLVTPENIIKLYMSQN